VYNSTWSGWSNRIQKLVDLGVPDPQNFLIERGWEDSGYSLTTKGKDYQDSLDTKLDKSYEKVRLKGDPYSKKSMARLYRRLDIFFQLERGGDPTSRWYFNTDYLSPKKVQILNLAYKNELGRMEKEGLIERTK